MNIEQKKLSIKIRNSINGGNRRFVMDGEIEHTKKLDYKFAQLSMQLVSMAREGIGTISDAYIMYAICLMGVCDLRTISTFLENLKRKQPDLVIMDTTIADNLRTRMRQFYEKGFLYTIGFEVPNWSGEAYEQANFLKLFTPTRDTVNFVNKKLNKRVSHNEMIQAMPPRELMGWAAATYVGTNMAASRYFEGYLDRVFRNRILGSIYLPMELLFQRDNNRYYVAIMKAFIMRDERIQTEQDFNEYIAYFISTINQYIRYRTKKGIACVVITVMDNADLVRLGNYIHNSTILDDCLSHVFFTGEGAVNMGRNLTGDFLQMQYIGDEIEYVPALPVFIG